MMTHSEYRVHLLQAYMLVRLAALLPLEEMLVAHARADAIGPILDPTAYRNKERAMLEDREVLRSLRDAAVMGRKVLAIADGDAT